MGNRLGSLVGAAVLSLAVAAPLGSSQAAAAPTTTTPARGYTIGIAPTTVTFSNALRSGDYQNPITIINGSPAGAWFTVKPAGAIASWLRVVQGPGQTKPVTRVFVPNGAEGTMLALEAQVPPTAANGAYAGQLNVNLVPPGATKQGSVSTGVGVQVNVAITVTGTEVVGGSVIEAYTYPQVEVGSPVPVFVRIKNTSNITVQPGFAMKVTKSAGHGVVYKWAGTTGEGLLPNQTSVYEVTWPGSATLTQTLGGYVAKMGVTFPEAKTLGTYKLPFQLVPYGSLHRGGKLLSLKLANHPQVGYSAEVNATVQSTGEVQQETSFVGELYRNGVLVQGIKSLEPILLAPAGQAGANGVITMPIPITKNGLYRVTGVANFAGAQSRAQSLTFRVGPAPVPLTYEIAAAVVAVAIVLLALLVFRRRRPPPAPGRRYVQDRHTATRARTLYVPPKSPVGSSPGRSVPRARRGYPPHD
jgi:hypothetical protein